MANTLPSMNLKDASGKSFVAKPQTYGGPIALVTFYRTMARKRGRVKVGWSRLDLDKVMFIDPLPASIAKVRSRFIQNLVDHIACELDPAHCG